jgi:integral membrane protein (TIGR01906 family)
VIGLPLLLVPLNLRLVVHNLGFYEAEFDRYRIEFVTGISKTDLLGASQALSDYFNGEDEPFSYQLRSGQEIYNEREIAHLSDVKGLLRLADGIGTAAGLGFTFGLAVQVAVFGRRRLDIVGRSLLLGGLVTLGLLGGLALLALSDFSGAFLQFHYLAFSNDLWQLDPRTDNLIRMFPEGFFFDATLLVAVATAVEAAVILSLGVLLRVLGSRAKRSA